MSSIDQIQVRLAQVITQSFMTQNEIAKCLGIHPAQISRYVHGKKMPSLDTLARLCKLLDVDANYILCQDLL